MTHPHQLTPWTPRPGTATRRLPREEGRFVCAACMVELRVVRIGVWRCPTCEAVGSITNEVGGFVVGRVLWEHRDWPTERLTRVTPAGGYIEPEGSRP